MLTTLLIYYGGCALGLFGMAKVVEHLPESDGKSSGTDDYGSSSYDDNLALTENQMECRICRK